MELPDKLLLTNTEHGHGDRGFIYYKDEDTQGFGIVKTSRKQSHKEPFVHTYMLDALPDQEFSSYAALREAALKVTPEDVAAEAARYPVFHTVEVDPCNNKCRLCDRDKPAADETWRVTIKTAWKKFLYFSLCKDHLDAYEGKAKELVAAIEAESEARRQKRLAIKQCAQKT